MPRRHCASAWPTRYGRTASCSPGARTSRRASPTTAPSRWPRSNASSTWVNQRRSSTRSRSSRRRSVSCSRRPISAKACPRSSPSRAARRSSRVNKMDFALTEEQLAVQKIAHQFARDEVLPKAAEIDREHRHPTELVKRMAELGFLGIAVPEQYGGSGMDHVSYVLAMEEVSRACASTGVIMSVNNSLVCDPIYRFGTEAQKQEWLKPLASGQLLGCFALSEPEAGSDAAAQKTTAVKDGDGWLLQGTKNWITNGPVADVCVLFAMNDRAAGHKGITAFLVPLKTKGVRCGQPDDKLGIRGS